MGTKYKKEKNIILLYTLNVKVILHYITLTGCDMVNDTEITCNHITKNMWARYKKENIITLLYTLNRSYIT